MWHPLKRGARLGGAREFVEEVRRVLKRRGHGLVEGEGVATGEVLWMHHGLADSTGEIEQAGDDELTDARTGHLDGERKPV